MITGMILWYQIWLVRWFLKHGHRNWEKSWKFECSVVSQRDWGTWPTWQIWANSVEEPTPWQHLGKASEHFWKMLIWFFYPSFFHQFVHPLFLAKKKLMVWNSTKHQTSGQCCHLLALWMVGPWRMTVSPFKKGRRRRPEPSGGKVRFNGQAPGRMTWEAPPLPEDDFWVNWMLFYGCLKHFETVVTVDVFVDVLLFRPKDRKTSRSVTNFWGCFCFTAGKSKLRNSSAAGPPPDSTVLLNPTIKKNKGKSNDTIWVPTVLSKTRFALPSFFVRLTWIWLWLLPVHWSMTTRRKRFGTLTANPSVAGPSPGAVCQDQRLRSCPDAGAEGSAEFPRSGGSKTLGSPM